MLAPMRSRAVVITAVVLAFMGACAGGKSEQSSDTTNPNAPSPPTTPVDGTTPHGYVDQGDYSFGRHIARITAIDVAHDKLTVDVMQFLTGDAATKAYEEDTGEKEPPENDYYVRNQNKQLRTFSVVADVDIRVNNSGGFPPADPGEGHQVDWATFGGYFTGDPAPGKYGLFWITLEGGLVTEIAEQFVP